MVLMLAVSLLINMVLIFLYTSLKRDLKALRSQIQYANENNSRFPFFTGSVNHDLKKIICLLNIKKEESIKIMNQICRMDQNLKDMIADIAHDIRTPLTSEMCIRDRYMEHLKHVLWQINQHIDVF